MASGLEARLEDVHRSAIGAANAAELQLILGVVLGDANLSSWQSFRCGSLQTVCPLEQFKPAKVMMGQEGDGQEEFSCAELDVASSAGRP